MILKGRAHKFGRDVDTDVIIPAQYLDTTDPDELAKHCMEGLDKEFLSRVNPGDVVVADDNFGCGSSREHAPVAIKAAGISGVIAKSFARIFFRNAINIGLPIFESKDAPDDVKSGDEVKVDAAKGEILIVSTGKVFKIQPFPEFIQDIISEGGLINYVRKQVSK